MSHLRQHARLLPEYKLPEDVTGTTTESVAPDIHLLRWSGEETLYPFWAVERVTAKWMRKSNAILGTSQLEFNMGFKMMEVACVTVGAVSGSSFAIAVSVRVPVLTNTRALEKDTRLSLEVAARPLILSGT